MAFQLQRQRRRRRIRRVANMFVLPWTLWVKKGDFLDFDPNCSFLSRCNFFQPLGFIFPMTGHSEWEPPPQSSFLPCYDVTVSCERAPIWFWCWQKRPGAVAEAHQAPPFPPDFSKTRSRTVRYFLGFEPQTLKITDPTELGWPENLKLRCFGQNWWFRPTRPHQTRPNPI